MKAITTKYLGPTDFRGSRIKASDSDGNTITVPYPSEANMGIEAHSKGALALCVKMGWKGVLIGGWTGDGAVFVFANSDRFAIPDRIEIRS